MLLDSANETVDLGAEVGRGGEGTVYAVLGRPGAVAKIYAQLPDAERVDKITTMVGLYAANSALGEWCAWPRSLLRDGAGTCRGFLMARVEGHTAIHDLYNPEHRKAILPEVGWEFLVRTAANCARMFASLHGFGVVVGDVNERNLLVGRDATVHLVDCDSFQIRTSKRLFTTGVGVVDYTPPELQGVDFRSAVHTPNHDRFGLAVLLFKLLFMGRHPFSGGATGDLSTAIREHDFDYAALSGRLRHLVPLQAVPQGVAALFARALGPADSGDVRPAPEQWLAQLEAFEAALVPCAVDPLHKGLPGAARCLWCQIEATLHYAYFARPRGDAYVSTWSHRLEHLDALQHALAGVESPLDPSWFEPLPEVRQALAAARTVLAKEPPPNPLTFYARALAGLALTGGLVGQWRGASWATGALLTAAGCATAGEVWRQVHRRPILMRNEQLTEAVQTLDRTEADWRGEAYRFREQDRRLRAQFDALRLRHESLGQLRNDTLERLEGDVVRPELRPFLVQFALDAAAIPGVPTERKRALLIRGMLTAADLERGQLLGIPGLSGSAVEALVAWRQALEQQAGAARKPPPTHAQLAAVDANYTHLQENLEDEMRNCVALARQATVAANAALDALYVRFAEKAKDTLRVSGT